MAIEAAPTLRCYMAVPLSAEYEPVAQALRRGAEAAGYSVTSPRDHDRDGSVGAAASEELARADCVIADLTDSDPNVLYEIGMAHAMGKAIFLVAQLGSNIPSDLKGYTYIVYRPNKTSITQLSSSTRRQLTDLRNNPAGARGMSSTRFIPPFFVEWDRLEKSEIENLCRELLMQMGYRQVDWVKLMPDLDLVAELPKKDPDGFEYRELWLISMGRKVPFELIELTTHDPEYLLHRLFRESNERINLEKDSTITFLVIALDDETPHAFRKYRNEKSLRRFPGGVGIRMRFWSRQFLTQLIQRFPQIGWKYFSDQARSRAKYRKTVDELYQENVELSRNYITANAALKEEQNRRLRAERDAAWKDISFAAAHKLGNPVFAIETNMDPLRKRIIENRKEEAILVTDEILVSVEKAKDIVDQFKSLTRVQRMEPSPILLQPILEHSCDRASKAGISCTITCPQELKVLADRNRIAECFDELVANSSHWLDKADKPDKSDMANRKIDIDVTIPEKTDLPQTVDSSRRYANILFKNNGPGIPVPDKVRIFDAFFTTRDQGTGLGLALVRRIIEGHGGVISEIGVPAEGVKFSIYMPLAEEQPEIQ